MRYDLESALQTLDFSDSVTCRAVEYQSIFKTLLSVDHSTSLMRDVSAKTGKMFREVMAMRTCNDVVTEWMGRRVKYVAWNGDRRLRVYHD